MGTTSTLLRWKTPDHSPARRRWSRGSAAAFGLATICLLSPPASQAQDISALRFACQTGTATACERLEKEMRQCQETCAQASQMQMLNPFPSTPSHGLKGFITAFPLLAAQMACEVCKNKLGY